MFANNKVINSQQQSNQAIFTYDSSASISILFSSFYANDLVHLYGIGSYHAFGNIFHDSQLVNASGVVQNFKHAAYNIFNQAFNIESGESNTETSQNEALLDAAGNPLNTAASTRYPFTNLATYFNSQADFDNATLPTEDLNGKSRLPNTLLGAIVIDELPSFNSTSTLYYYQPGSTFTIPLDVTGSVSTELINDPTNILEVSNNSLVLQQDKSLDYVKGTSNTYQLTLRASNSDGETTEHVISVIVLSPDYINSLILDNGTDTNDFITNQTNLVVKGSYVQGSEMTLTLTGSTSTPQTFDASSNELTFNAAQPSATYGSWLLDLSPLNLTAGDYTLTYSDSLGSTQTVDLTIDMTAPEPPVLTQLGSTEFNPNEKIAVNNNATLSGTYQSENGAVHLSANLYRLDDASGARKEVALVSNPLSLNATDNTWSMNLSNTVNSAYTGMDKLTGLPDGVYVLELQTEDVAGNKAENTAFYKFSLYGIQPPVFNGFTDNTGFFDNDAITTDTTPTFSVSYDPNIDFANVKVQVIDENNTLFETIFDPAQLPNDSNFHITNSNDSWNIEFRNPANKLGKFDVSIELLNDSDEVLAKSFLAGGVTIVDSTLSDPTITLEEDTNGNRIINATSPQFSGSFDVGIADEFKVTITDNSGSELITTVDNTNYTPGTSPVNINPDGSWSYQASNLDEGTYTIDIQTSAENGNTTSKVTLDFTIDTTLDTPSIKALAQDTSYDAVLYTTDFITNQSPNTLEFNGSMNI